MKNRFLKGIVASLAITLSGFANAALIFDNLGNIEANDITDETRVANSAIMTHILVGGSDVDITGMGVFGALRSDGDYRFVIFDSLGTLNYLGGVQSSLATGLQWFDSLAFNLTLTANTSYYMGLISDQSFTYRWSLDAPQFTMGGLTSTAGGISGTNGNASNFLAPNLDNTCCIVQQSLRLSSGVTSVPEPSTLAIFALGMFGLASRKYKK